LFLELEHDQTIAALARVFKNKVLPLLEEYFFDDREKISKILGGAGIYVERDRTNLGFESKSKPYDRNDASLAKSETYIRIYRPVTSGGSAVNDE
jgi:5-methylcytosine-specific restriction protein B